MSEARHGGHHTDCASSRECALDRRVLAHWPGLDRRALARCSHDPHRIAALVARRTSMPFESILALLTPVA